MIRNPLSLRGTDLTPVALLIARLVALSVIGQQILHRHIPYFPELEGLGTPSEFRHVLRALSRLGFVLLLVTPWARLGSLLIGGVLLTGLLACRPCQSVAHTYVACVLLVLACSSRRTGVSLLRLQVVILYAAAALNKVFDVDWWNGRYFETLMIDRHGHALYAWVSDLLPPLLLSKVMGIASIAIEAILAVCFLRPGGYRFGVWLGVAFHSAMVLLLNATFGPFYAAMLASYLAFVHWPERVETRFSRWAPDWNAPSTPGAVAVLDRRTWTGVLALQRLILVHPAFYYVVAALLHPLLPLEATPGLIVLVLAAFFAPTLLAELRASLPRRRAAAAP